MTLHHTKHHQTYVNGLNAAEEAYANTDSTAKKISLQSALKFNGGGKFAYWLQIICYIPSCVFSGHINHSLFWKNLAPASEKGGKLISGGELEKAIRRDFGSVEEFKKQMNTKTAAIQGSGWGWLVRAFANKLTTGDEQSPNRDMTRLQRSWKS